MSLVRTGRVREGGRTPHLLALPLLAGLILAACAPGTPRAQLGDGIQQGSGQPQPTLAIVLRVEPVGMTDSASSLNRISLALFSAYLAQKDNKENPYPVLATAVPRLNTDTWRILPDGKMETTFRLRSGLTWHDGHPLTAEDFAFGRRVAMAKIEWGL